MKHQLLMWALIISIPILSISVPTVKSVPRKVYLNILWKQDTLSRLPSYAHYRIKKKCVKP
jgi:hypothetical protein